MGKLGEILTDEAQRQEFVKSPFPEQVTFLRRDNPDFARLPLDKQIKALREINRIEERVRPARELVAPAAARTAERLQAIKLEERRGPLPIERQEAKRQLEQFQRIVTIPAPIVGGFLEFLAKPLAATAALKRRADAVRQAFDTIFPGDPKSRSVFKNMLSFMAKEVPKEYLALNIETITSIAGLMSMAVPGAAKPAIAAFAKAAKLVKVGKRKSATRALRVGVAQGVKALGQLAAGVGEVATGIQPFRAVRALPTVAEVAVLPAVRAGARAVAVGVTRGVAAAREVATGVPAARTVAAVERGLVPRGAELPEEVIAAGFRGREIAEGGVRQAAQFVKDVEARQVNIFERVSAGELIDNGIVKQQPVISRLVAGGDEGAKLAVEIAKTNNKLASELMRKGFPRQIFERFRGRYVGAPYLADSVPTANLRELTLGVDEMLQEGVQSLKRSRPFVTRPQAAQRFLRRKNAVPKGTDVVPRQVRTIIQENNLKGFAELQNGILAQPGLVSNVAGPGLRRISPEAAVVSRLRGKFVPERVADELLSFQRDVNFMSSPGAIKKVISLYKETLTVDNPLTWMGNILGNTMIASVNRVGSPLTRPAFFAETARQFVKGSPDFDRATVAGVFASGQTARTVEGELVRDIMKTAAAEAKGSDLGLLFNLGASYRKLRPFAPQQLLRRFYQSQDDFFRFLGFRELTKRGIPDPQAAVQARTMFGDLNRTPRVVRSVSSSPLLVMPFVSWQYAILPQLAQSFIKNPMAAVRWKHGLNAWNKVTALAMGEDPSVVDRYNEFRALAQPPGAERQFTLNHPMLLLPLRDAHGQQLGIDLTSFNPYGSALTGGQLALGPVLSTLFSAVTGREIIQEKVGGTIGKDQLAIEIARRANIPPRTVRQIFKAGLLKSAKWENGRPANRAAEILTKTFRTFEIAPSPISGPALSAEEELSRAFGPRLVRLDVPRAAQRAAFETRRRKLEIEEAAKKAPERLVIRELEQGVEQ